MNQGSSTPDTQRSPATLTCARCGASCRAQARFCDECGARLAKAALPERRPLTVVFCDMVGSTTLAAGVDPEDCRAVLTRFHRCVSATMREFGGHVARFIGDAALVYFGYPRAQEDDAERAIHAALAATTRVGALRDQHDRPLQSRIGIATGLVVIGNLHDDDAPDVLDVAGEPPNLAARLQGIAEAGGIVVAPETRKRVGELFIWRDLGELSLKGYRDAVRAWAVVEARPAASRYDAQHESGMAPMLGREELRIGLFEHWREACEGKGRVVLIRGEAGVGKSRLAAAVLEAPGERYTLRYYSSPLRQGSPLHPCVQQLEWASVIAREDSPQTRLDKLDASLGDTPGEDKGLLAELLNLPAAERFAVPELSPQVKRRRTLESLLAQLERLARSRPILVVFEDAQWSDLSTLELLELAVERVSRLPVLLLVLARPEFEPQWAALAHVFRMTLAPLGPADAAQLVEWVAAGRGPVAADDRQHRRPHRRHSPVHRRDHPCGGGRPGTAQVRQQLAAGRQLPADVAAGLAAVAPGPAGHFARGGGDRLGHRPSLLRGPAHARREPARAPRGIAGGADRGGHRAAARGQALGVHLPACADSRCGLPHHGQGEQAGHPRADRDGHRGELPRGGGPAPGHPRPALRRGRARPPGRAVLAEGRPCGTAALGDAGSLDPPAPRHRGAAEG